MHISAQTKYKVALSPEEKTTLLSLIRKGSTKVRTVTRGRILLLADQGKKDTEIRLALQIATTTPHDTRKKFVDGGLSKALNDAPRPGRERKLSGIQEAEVVAIACSQSPKGYSHWTLDLLTEEVQNKLKVSIGRTAVYRVLLRNKVKPWLKKMWCIPNVTDDFKKNA